jgi:hypothetical membrane protein
MSSNELADHRSTPTTRPLLRCGVVVGVLYLAVGVIQGLVRDSFDFRRHALSHLANGPGGWVQTANLAVCGLMVIGAAIGIARVLPSRAAGWLLGCFGAGMVVASIFPTDPVDGFPPGTPLGVPTTMSTSALIHLASGAIGFVTLAAACFVVARAMSRRKQPSMARLSFVCGLAVLIGFFAPVAIPDAGSAGIAGIWFAVVVGWAWLAVTSTRLIKAA